MILIVTACNKGDEPIPDLNALNDLLEEIEQLSASQTCEDADQWKFTALGLKPCGGPSSYIAYSSKIDTTLFLDKVKRYNKEVMEYNKKTGAVSDCALIEKPAEVLCDNGSPVFLYRLE
ncbi:MAG TPA: hypothetical protein VKN36_05905 [Eudoraea sp.]|nr:hypothetical protein [Eudoraea sp.]